MSCCVARRIAVTVYFAMTESFDNRSLIGSLILSAVLLVAGSAAASPGDGPRVVFESGESCLEADALARLADRTDDRLKGGTLVMRRSVSDKAGEGVFRVRAEPAGEGSCWLSLWSANETLTFGIDAAPADEAVQNAASRLAWIITGQSRSRESSDETRVAEPRSSEPKGELKSGPGRPEASRQNREPDGPGKAIGAYVGLRVGSGLGVLTGGGEPTANPQREIRSGLAPAIGHLMLETGPRFGGDSRLALTFRWQFSPTQDFDAIRSGRGPIDGPLTKECLGLGLKGDCEIGLSYRGVLKRSSLVDLYVRVGGGFGRVRHVLKLKERANSAFCDGKDLENAAGSGAYCNRHDSYRPGFLYAGLGGGVAWRLSRAAHLTADVYFQLLFPDVGINVDATVGPEFVF